MPLLIWIRPAQAVFSCSFRPLHTTHILLKGIMSKCHSAERLSGHRACSLDGELLRLVSSLSLVPWSVGNHVLVDVTLPTSLVSTFGLEEKRVRMRCRLARYSITYWCSPRTSWDIVTLSFTTTTTVRMIL